jgi:hypothetical protein
MKTAIDTAQLKQSISLVDLVGRYTELRKVSPKEWHGPCPWCGGDDRFRVTADYFACRQCGRKGDAIEFVMQQRNVDFKEAVSLLGGNIPMNTSEKRKPISKPVESAYEWDEPKHKQAVIASHVNLMAASTGYARQCMTYLQGRGIEPATVQAFGVGYTSFQLPNTWNGKEFVYPKQLAISLGWFNHDGALVAVKYRFIEPHSYTDKDGKEQTGKDGKGVRFTSRGQIEGNCFGWQRLQGPDKRQVLIICEGEINDLSLWQVGRNAVDVLSTGSEATTKKLPPVVVDLAAKYKHCIVWADKKDIADKAAAQIGAASMASPGGKDANDLLQAGKLGALLTAMLGRLGVSLPAESRTDDAPVHTPASHTGMRTGDTLIIKDAQPLDLNFESEQPAVDKVAAMAEQLRSIAALPSFDERLDALEPLHAAIGALTYAEVRDPSIAAELLKIFKKQSAVDSFLNKYGAKTPPTVASFDLSFDTPPTPPTADPLQPDQLAYYKQFVGQVVTDEQMTGLYMAAHRNGFKLTSEAQGNWWAECDYKVTGCHG